MTGKSPINNVGAILNSQLKKSGEIVRVGRGMWALSSWAPPSKAKPDGARVGRGFSHERVLAMVRSDAPVLKYGDLVPRVAHVEAIAAGLRNGLAEAT